MKLRSLMEVMPNKTSVRVWCGEYQFVSGYSNDLEAMLNDGAMSSQVEQVRASGDRLEVTINWEGDEE